jgi:hypothetical protein
MIIALAELSFVYVTHEALLGLPRHSFDRYSSEWEAIRICGKTNVATVWTMYTEDNTLVCKPRWTSGR